MKIIRFDIRKGIYLTELTNFASNFHTHPAMEILLAHEGSFSIVTPKKNFENLRFAIIDSNIEHKLKVVESKVDILLVEHCDAFLKNYFLVRNLKIVDGLHVSKSKIDQLIILEIISEIALKSTHDEYDPRVQKVIEFLRKSPVSYFDLRRRTQEITSLSYSRFSHLFKQNLGMSLKKYLVWCNLRNTIEAHLNQKEELMGALLSNGFYDQPHFNKCYKAFIGTTPARTYRQQNLTSFDSQS